jgi:tRNA threonylcarbamoyladenosine biosynthesis protein TsaE
VIQAVTKNGEDTRALAGELAGLVRANDVILLCGDLGAGKTTFVQGLARALHVQEAVTSPTFVLARQYEGDLPIAHLDVYRLDYQQEVIELGLQELADDDCVVVVEWGDMVAQTLPADFLEIRLEFGDAADERNLMLRTVGERWTARLAAIHRALSRWTREG